MNFWLHGFGQRLRPKTKTCDDGFGQIKQIKYNILHNLWYYLRAMVLSLVSEGEIDDKFICSGIDCFVIGSGQTNNIFISKILDSNTIILNNNY